MTNLAGIGEDAILSAAKSLNVVIYVRGDIIIEENELGDSFYILEEGIVRGTVML